MKSTEVVKRGFYKVEARTDTSLVRGSQPEATSLVGWRVRYTLHTGGVFQLPADGFFTNQAHVKSCVNGLEKVGFKTTVIEVRGRVGTVSQKSRGTTPAPLHLR